MRLFLLFIIFIVSTHESYAQKSARLTGEIINPTGDKVFFYKRLVVNGRIKAEAKDSCKIGNDGSFSLKTTVDRTEEIVFYDGKEQFIMLLSPGDKMHVTLNTLYFDETIQFTGKGSEKNNALKNVNLIKETNLSMVRDMVIKDDVDTVALYKLQRDLNASLLELIEDYKRKIPEIEKGVEPIELYIERSLKVLKNTMRQRLAFKEQLKSITDKKAIDFTGINLKGDSVALSDFKGKVIVVDFWATWCVPCKAEFPAYKELEEKYGNDVNFVSVGVYCKEEDWRKMAEKEGFKNNIFISKEAEEEIKAYSVKTIPRYLVIDENFNLIDGDAPRPSSGDLQDYWK